MPLLHARVGAINMACILSAYRCSYFKRFSGKYKDIFNKFKITLKQHIKDGIPLPLNTVGRLNRMITVRGGL